MSFSENPYRWFEFFTTSDESHLIVHCGGCGGESDLLPVGTPATEIMRVQANHLMKSHERSPSDFADWSQPNHRDKDLPKGTPPITNEQRRFADYLAEYVSNVAAEWMRIIDVDEDVLAPGAGFFQARVTWMDDGTFHLGETRSADPIGDFRLITRVEPIYVPPIGPENDSAMQYELQAEEQDPSNISGGDETPDPIEPQEPSPEWVPAMWRYVLTGDRIRLNGQEADVERSSVIEFHADNTNKYEPTRWDHTEVNIKLAHLPNSLNFPPNAEVEILMDRERKAIHLLQGTFEATKIGEK
jgi:hypothetical protein